MKKTTWPSISVIIPTYNSSKMIDICLGLVRIQDYPQEKIEIIVADGGSRDDTVAVAKTFKAKIINVPTSKQNAEYNRGVAFAAAKGELVLVLDHDNFLPHKHWLKGMTIPLLKHPEMVATQPCYYHYDRSYSALDRYFSLYGASEPLPIFLHKSDRLMQTSKHWDLVGRSETFPTYYKVTFPSIARKFPCIGSNGCLQRRMLIKKYSKCDPDNHFPIDVLVDLLPKGFCTFGFIKDSIIHITGHSGLYKFFWRRLKFVDDYHFRDAMRRRYSVVMPGDGAGVARYVVYSLTLVGPIINSLKGFMRIPDPAWFLHPLFCLVTTVIYGYTTIKHWLNISSSQH